MAGKADVKVTIDGDAKPLEREVARARQGVHGFARDIEGTSRSMNLFRMPRINLLSGLFGGLSIAGAASAISSVVDSALKTKETITSSGLPTEEYLRLTEAAKKAKMPVEQVNDLIKDYSTGKKSLEEIAGAFGFVGYQVGAASEEIKELAIRTERLAAVGLRKKELGAKFSDLLQEGVSNIVVGKAVILKMWEDKTLNMAQAYQAVIEDETQRYFQNRKSQRQQMEDKDQKRQDKMLHDKRQAEWKKEDLEIAQGRYKRNTKQIDEQVADERQAYIDKMDATVAAATRKMEGVVALSEAEAERDKAIQGITVQGPRAANRLGAIGGFTGAMANNAERMAAERKRQHDEIMKKFEETKELLGQ